MGGACCFPRRIDGALGRQFGFMKSVATNRTSNGTFIGVTSTASLDLTWENHEHQWILHSPIIQNQIRLETVYVSVVS